MDWLSSASTEEHKQFIRTVSAFISRSVEHHDVKELDNFIQGDNLRAVVDYPINYNSNISVDAIRAIRQIKALVEKQDFLDLGFNQLKTAERKFLDCELKCLETNERLWSGHPAKAGVSEVLHYAIRKIDRILGRCPELGELSFQFGPGANTNVKMSEACYRSKLSADLMCSSEMLPVVGKFLAEFPMWVAHHAGVSTLEGSTFLDVKTSSGKLVFVPKNSKTFRPIVVEPLLNSMMQKGIGGYLKKRLMRHGIDLSDQTRNQRLAMLGSLHGNLATVDLSSASDCLSLSLVDLLIPTPWQDLLSSCRTGEVKYENAVLQLEKFSSMGNGYTFELESLVFYALAFGVCVHLDLPIDQLSVYGDDIIIPSMALGLLEEVLEYCGFAVNREKSFSEGPFRESCGADWYFGLDVRPFYLREKVSGRVLFLFHNWAVRNCEPNLAKEILNRIPDHLRLWGPDGFGDGHLIGSYSLRLNRTQRRCGWGGGFFDTYSLRKRLFKKLLPGDWLVPLYSIYTRASGLDPSEPVTPVDPNVVRGSEGYAKVSIYTLKTSVF